MYDGRANPALELPTSEPQRYVALLRGVNVGGHSVVKMVDLRAWFEALGLSDVSTYIQSGNVLFTTNETDTESLACTIEAYLKSALGYHVTTFVLSRSRLEQAAANNPFKTEDGELQCHVMFLSAGPDTAHRDALMAMQGEEYRFAFYDRLLYYAYPRTYAGHRRTVNFEKVLDVTGTARTSKVVAALIELLS